MKTLFVIITLLAFSINLYSQDQDLEELLGLTIEELMDVEVITATKTYQKISRVPATVRVITAEEIKQKGYLTLEEAISNLPGFQFRNIVGFNSYVFLRGVPSQNNLILILVDGVQINELNSGGFYGGGQFNLSNVKQIEVVYGPASALYGTNAFSGVINIITRDPEDMSGPQASVLIGNFGTRNVDFSLGHYDENYDWGFSVSGMLKQSEKADLGGVKGDNNWTEDMENFEDDISIDGKLKYKNLSFGVVFQDKQASRTTNYKSVGTDTLDTGTNWHIRFINSHLKYLYDKSPKWSLLSQVYYRNATVMNNTIAIIRSAEGIGQVSYYRPNDLIGIENQISYAPVENSMLIVGIDWEQERLSEGFSKTYSGSPAVKPPVPDKPEMINNRLISGYLQGQYRFIDNVEFTVGIRHDNSDYYGTVNTPRLGLVYAKDALTAKLLYMEAFRAPKPWDYTWGDGNPDLQPERTKSFEIFGAYQLSSHLRAGMSVYKSFTESILTKEGNRWVNGDRINADGMEMTVDYIKGKIKSYLNYTYTLSRYKNGDVVPEIGENNSNLGITYAFLSNCRLGLWGNYLGERTNCDTISTTGSDIVDDALILNASISLLAIQGFDFHLYLKNLLDTEYYHTSNRLPDRYRQPQRTLIFKIMYSL